MDVIVGIGSAGSNIAEKFRQHTQYKVFTMSAHTTANVVLPEYQHPEEYEEANIKMAPILTKIKKEDKSVLCIVSGASLASGAVLRFLQQVHAKNKKINILYIDVDSQLLSKTKQLQSNTVKGVLQQYARSGVFECMYIINNECVENFVGETTILEYHDKLNEAIVQVVNLVNVFNNTKQISGTFGVLKPTSRIATFGVFDPSNGTESLFYNLTSRKESRYYYGITEENLRTEKNLLRKILDQVKAKLELTSAAGYGIYQTGYDENCGLVVAYTSEVQK